MKGLDKLNEKQRAFCEYYIETLNGSEAYRRAYKSCKTDGTARTNSSTLLTNTNVKGYIEKRLEEINDSRIAKTNEVLIYLTSVMRGEEKDQFDLEAPLSERTKAAELLGKRYKMFTDKVESNVTQTIVFEGEGDLED